MVLRKPYALFIKLFKPIHLLIGVLVAYLIYLNNKVLSFFNEYISSTSSVLGQNLRNDLGNNLLFIIPIIIMILSLIILGVMIRKKKPSTFYFVNFFIFLVVLVLNIYAVNFLGVLEESIVAIKSVKLIRDFMTINIILESVSFVFFIVRGMGINIKKFDFSSEISKFDIEDSDREEFELNIGIDINESKTKRKQRLRNYKYIYKENKFIINLSIVIFIALTLIVSALIVINKDDIKKENVYYSTSTFNIKVNETAILKENYQGRKLTDNYLVVASTTINNKKENNTLRLKDFSLIIGDAVFKPTKDYSKYLLDIGKTYEENALSKGSYNYIFVFEIPEKFSISDMYFRYDNLNIKVNPKSLKKIDKQISSKYGESLSFDESLGSVNFNISSFELSDRFIVTYNFCASSNNCMESREYLTPTLNTNFDKTILKLNVDYNSDSELGIDNFYQLISNFGSIVYSKNGTTYTQNSDFEEIKSSKKKENNTSYIGVDKNIMSSDSIKFVFNIRGSVYEYVLK